MSMEDWGAVRARLEKEEERLRLKAANLKQRHGEWSLMAKQELETAADIRAALDRIRELEEELVEARRQE